MDYRPLGRTETRLSRLGLGTAGFARLAAQQPSRPARLLDAFLDAGGTLVDTADSYADGDCEEVLGRLLTSRRDRVVLSTKVGWPSAGRPGGLAPEHVRRSVDDSLRRLRTECIDLYQLHFYDDQTPIEDTFEALDDCLRAGKVRSVGASAFFAWQLAHANGVAARTGWPRLESVQLSYNLAQRDAEREHLGYCTTQDVTVIVYSPLHGGTLSGAWAAGTADRLDDPVLRQIYLSPREDHVGRVSKALHEVGLQAGQHEAVIGLAWLLRRPVGSVLVGPDTVDELELDLASLAVQLPTDAWAQLDAASALDWGYPSSFYERKEQMWSRFSVPNAPLRQMS